MYNQTLKYRKRLHILCGFSLFLTCKFSSFCRPKYPKKNILFQTLCAAFGGQTVAVCLLTTTSDVWQFSCGFLRFPVIFPWTNCKRPFLDHLANGEKEWPFVVGQLELINEYQWQSKTMKFKPPFYWIFLKMCRMVDGAFCQMVIMWFIKSELLPCQSHSPSTRTQKTIVLIHKTWSLGRHESTA